MKTLFFRITYGLLLLTANQLPAPELRFNQVLKNMKGQFSGMKQDKQGFLWIITFDQGLKRYNGIDLKTYTHDPRNPNSIASNSILRCCIDADNMIWLG